MTRADRDDGFEVVIQEAPAVVLYAERLRDGRIALGTREERSEGDWDPGEMHILEPRAMLALAAGVAPWVNDAWIDSVRERQPAPLETAAELYGAGPDGATRLAMEMLAQIPPSLMARGLILLANAIGPDSRHRLVHQLNRTTDRTADDVLRRQLSEEHEAFGYAVAAAALFDALARGVVEETEEDGE